jgi:hypothetical protein
MHGEEQTLKYSSEIFTQQYCTIKFTKTKCFIYTLISLTHWNQGEASFNDLVNISKITDM